VSFPAYPAYRPSGVEWLGDLPAHWRVKRGRFCMQVNPRAARFRELAPGDHVSFVPMDAVGERGELELQATHTVAEGDPGYTQFQDGDVVFAKITPCFENGKGALARGLVNGAAFGTTELHVLRAGPSLDPRFLYYLTVSRPFRGAGQAEMYGAGGQKRVPADFARDFPTPLPSPGEQRAVAGFLDARTEAIDRLIGRKSRLLRLLEEEREAVVYLRATGRPRPDGGASPTRPAVGGLEWAGELPHRWETTRIKHAARIESGHTPSRGVDEYWEDATIPWLSLNDSRQLRHRDRIHQTAHRISEPGLANSSARLLPAGAVVLSRDATVGLSAITTRPMAVSQHFVAYLCGPRLLPEYLLLSLKAMGQHLERLSLGATIPTIGMDDIRSLRCPLPPVHEQREIVARVRREVGRIDRLAARVQTAIERLREYRAALITAAVTGKIDVRGAAR